MGMTDQAECLTVESWMLKNPSTAAVAFPNGTTVDVGRVEGTSEYTDVLARLSLQSSAHPTYETRPTKPSWADHVYLLTVPHIMIVMPNGQTNGDSGADIFVDAAAFRPHPMWPPSPTLSEN